MKNNYVVQGNETIIYLPRKDGNFLETKIDTDDLHHVISWGNVTWYGVFQKSTNSFYVQGHVPGTKQGKVYLHRWLTSATEGMDVDHINHDTLDNRRSANLRVVTRSRNMLNQKNKQGSPGVCVRFHKKAKKWEASVRIDGKYRYVGLFLCKEQARESAKKINSLKG